MSKPIIQVNPTATIERSNPTAPNCSNKNERPNKKSKNQKIKKIKIKSYLNVILFTIELHTSHTKTNKLDKLSLKKM
jgi:hypothetical protein